MACDISDIKKRKNTGRCGVGIGVGIGVGGRSGLTPNYAFGLQGVIHIEVPYTDFPAEYE
jgi:hypothetical protein